MRIVKLLATILMVAALFVPVSSFGQRRGSFGGSRSFGGMRSGSSFGSSGGSFRGGSSFGGIRGGSSGSRPSTGSFGSSRSSSSSFGGPRTFTSTQSRGGSPFAPRVGSYGGPGFHSYGSSYYYNNYPVRYYGGGYGSYWFHPAWYYWTPFHPAFYYGAPYYSNGYYEPGGFSFLRLLMAIFIFVVIFAIIARLLSRR